MGESDGAMAFPLVGVGLSVALRHRRRAHADSQSLCREHQGRAVGGDEPRADCVAGGHRRLEPVAGAALAWPKGIPACFVCLAGLPDCGWAGAAELSGVVGFANHPSERKLAFPLWMAGSFSPKQEPAVDTFDGDMSSALSTAGKNGRRSSLARSLMMRQVAVVALGFCVGGVLAQSAPARPKFGA